MNDVDDPVLGPLTWSPRDTSWHGRARVDGRRVRVSLATGLTDPSDEEKLAVIGPSRPLLGRVIAAEPSLRRLAARELAGLEFSRPASAPGIERTLRLVEIGLGVCRQLDYRLRGLFRRRRVTIALEDDLSYREVEIY